MSGIENAKSSNSGLRNLPAVARVLEGAEFASEAASLPQSFAVEIVRQVIDDFRTSMLDSDQPDESQFADGMLFGNVVQECVRRVQVLRAPNVRRTINATGIIVHTGMGRSPLATEALDAAREASEGYCDVAISRETGGRRKRSGIVAQLLKRLTGCEGSTVVNNNAAGVVLALAAHAKGREVIVSRGQLVEIGGSFRLPDVMATAGVTLREVGTTNRTRLSDYESAINPNTAAIMRIHPSNFRVVGFTEEVGIADLVRLGRERNIKVFDDIGSGALIDFSKFGLEGEPTARESIEAGVDLALFSGDKLLGGPQAGILIGKTDAVAACETHPLMRALRVDKMCLAALEATLRLYLDPESLPQRLPILRMIAEPLDQVKVRAERLAELLRTVPDLEIEIREDKAYVGGGSLPDQSLPTWVVAITRLDDAEKIKRSLRLGDPPIFARLRQGSLEFDLRTVRENELELISQGLRAACLL